MRDDNPYCALDPATLDPATDLCNPLRYVPSIPLNALGCALYGSAAAVLIYHQIRHWKLGKWFMVLPISVFCETVGIALRLWFRTNLHSLGGYIAMYMFVILSPCGFLAANYILLGRIARHLNADGYMMIRPERVSWAFVISDICTFIIQASGGAMSTSISLHTVGSNIFLAGLVIQLISFLLFTCMWVLFLVRARRDETVWKHPHWKSLYFALGWTCIFYIIRSVFRTVELSQGYTGFLSTHEPYVFGLDTIPLWVGLIVYCYWWPPAILTADRAIPPSSFVDHEESASATEMSTRAPTTPEVDEKY